MLNFEMLQEDVDAEEWKIKQLQPVQNDVNSRRSVTVKNKSEVCKEFEIKKVQLLQNNEK